jgi:hypothetical protein
LEKFPEFLLAILPIPEKIMEIFPSFRKQWLETSLICNYWYNNLLLQLCVALFVNLGSKKWFTFYPNEEQMIKDA